ncbi:MAG: hypothetical protein L6R41_006237 [Letrouitia leprolyta]|nr:MAG: hypothetical protein L6R41_006237 [Letrouitia leprolyta]
MGLVDYSESEGSDLEEKTQAQVQKSAAKPNKPAFQKVVDRSNPRKIQVNLPEPTKEPSEEKQEEEGPPAKRAKTGGGAFSGFNSLLPAPKRSAATNRGINGAKRGGLGSGVSLKTGSAPGFSREPVSESYLAEEDGTENIGGDDLLQENGDPPRGSNIEEGGGLNLPPPKSTSSAPDEPKKQGNAMMFKPLSVARKPQKKKAPPNTDGNPISEPKDSAILTKPTPPPRTSLFSVEPLQDHSTNGTRNSGTYEPLLYSAQNPGPPDADPKNPYILASQPPSEITPPYENAPEPQSLTSIASDLNLSESAKRQLFGRHNHKNPSSSSSPHTSQINVLNFNTSAEYAANELLRQSGEQQSNVLNPVRAIAPGKHSLKQLVNAASNQKDALEEQFASGRRNRKEAGGRYGW